MGHKQSNRVRNRDAHRRKRFKRVSDKRQLADEPMARLLDPEYYARNGEFD